MQVTISGCKFAVNDNTALIDCDRKTEGEGLSRIGIKFRDSYIVATKESKTSIYFIIDPVNTPMNQEDEERMLSSLSETEEKRMKNSNIMRRYEKKMGNKMSKKINEDEYEIVGILGNKIGNLKKVTDYSITHCSASLLKSKRLSAPMHKIRCALRKKIKIS